MKPNEKISQALDKITPLELAMLRKTLRENSNQIGFFVLQFENMMEAARSPMPDRAFLERVRQVIELLEDVEPVMDKLSKEMEILRTVPYTPPPMPTMRPAKPPLKRGVGVRTPGKKIATSQPKLGDVFDATPASGVIRFSQVKSESMWPDEELDDDIPF